MRGRDLAGAIGTVDRDGREPGWGAETSTRKLCRPGGIDWGRPWKPWVVNAYTVRRAATRRRERGFAKAGMTRIGRLWRRERGDTSDHQVRQPESTSELRAAPSHRRSLQLAQCGASWVDSSMIHRARIHACAQDISISIAFLRRAEVGDCFEMDNAIMRYLKRKYNLLIRGGAAMTAARWLTKAASLRSSWRSSVTRRAAVTQASGSMPGNAFPPQSRPLAR